jgi:polysaccharide biosynthesis transport protein
VTALRRRLLRALAVAGVGAAGAVAAVCLLLPAQSVVRSQVKLSQGSPVLLPRDQGEGELAVWKANQEGVLKSPLVLDQALRGARAKGLAVNDSVGSLAKALKVDFLSGPQIMSITLKGDDAETTAGLLNEVMAAYLGELRQQDLSRRAEVLKALDKKQKEFREELWKAESQLRQEEEREEKVGGVSPGRIKAESELLNIRRSNMEKELSTLRGEIARKTRALKGLQARDRNIKNEPVPEERVKKILSEDPFVQARLKTVADVNQRIAEIQATYREERHAKELRGPLQDKRRALDGLARLCEQLRPGVEQHLRAEIHETIKADILKIGAELESLNGQLEETAGALTKLAEQARRLDPENAPATPLMRKLRSEIKGVNATLTDVGREIAKYLGEPGASERARVLQRASAPQGRDYSRQIKFGGAAGLGVFGMLLFGVALVEFRSRKVGSADEVSRGLGLPLLGTVPALPARLRRPLPGSASPRDLQLQNQMTEAVDAVRTMLLHRARAEGLQVVMVTSAGGGEGKTSLASQLAASLARAGRKTLLIDGDLRNPAAHRLFDVPLEPGLSEVLRGEAGVGDVVRPTPLSRLWLVPAGSWDSHAVQSLAQDGVRALLAGLKGQYEFLIVDSCPVLPVADSLLLGQHVDAVIFSVLRDVSRMPAVHAAHQRLTALGVRTLGAVLIGGGGDLPALAYNYPPQTA